MTTANAKRIESLLGASISVLAASQHDADGRGHYAGEFPMTLRCPEARLDYNFLSGYVLLHLHALHEACGNRLPHGIRESIATMLHRGRVVPLRYRTAQGTNNWYHGKLSGDHTPPDFDWPNQLVLSIRDDMDDTAIAALLCSLDDSAEHHYAADTFTAQAYDPARHRLRPSSLRRLAAAGTGAGVYMTWSLPTSTGDATRATADARQRVEVPLENSVEMVTAANIYAAVHRLSSVSPATQSHRATKQFVNRLAQHALEALMAGQTDVMTFVARYYPRVPFAPVAYLLRDDFLANGTLLDAPTRALIGRALMSVDPQTAGQSAPYSAALAWLNAAGWCAYLGIVSPDQVSDTSQAVLSALAANYFDDNAGWPDFVFFKEAHIGDYSGAPYANSVAIEALGLLLGANCV